MSNQEIRYAVTELIQGSPDGTHGRGVCPICKGGRTEEKSFIAVVTSKGTFYKCYRASCGIQGYTDNFTVTPVGMPVGGTKKPFTYETIPLSEEWLKFFADKFELTKLDIEFAEWKYCPSEDRIVMPVKNPLGLTLGVQARSYRSNVRTKSLNYKEVLTEPFISWFIRPSNPEKVPLFVMEDQVSALKMSRFVPSLALIGTEISLEKAAEISKYFRNIVLILDADAWHKSLKLKKKITSLFPEMVASNLCVQEKSDVKEIPLERLKSWLKEEFKI